MPIELSKQKEFIASKVAPQACFGASTLELGRSSLKRLEAAIVKAFWVTTTPYVRGNYVLAHFGTPMKVHPQWFSILYAFRDLRRILLRRSDLRIRFLSLLTKRIQITNPLSGPGPTRTLLMHLTKCGWTKVPTGTHTYSCS